MPVKSRALRLGSIFAVLVSLFAGVALAATPAQAGQAYYKMFRVHNHAWYGLHADMVYESNDQFIAGTGNRTAIALGVTKTWYPVVDGDRGIEFFFRIEAGKSLWYNAGVAKYAPDYCFDTWGTTLSPKIYRTDCNTGQVI